MKQIYHPWHVWECYPAGFYESRPLHRNLSEGQCKYMYAQFLRDTPRFRSALSGVVREWPHSCEQYLSNERMNRIAWLGQAAMCYATGIPAVFCGGYNQLSPTEMETADDTALDCLNGWLVARGERHVSLVEAIQSTPMYIHTLGRATDGENTITGGAA